MPVRAGHRRSRVATGQTLTIQMQMDMGVEPSYDGATTPDLMPTGWDLGPDPISNSCRYRLRAVSEH
jgi:hypothetical protein